MNNVIRLSEQIAKNLSETTKHIEFLATIAPEIRDNLQSIAANLQVVQKMLGTVYEMQENAHKQTVSAFELEKACKNQAYDFILAERLINRFQLFRSCYPVNKYNSYDKKTGCII